MRIPPSADRTISICASCAGDGASSVVPRVWDSAIASRASTTRETVNRAITQLYPTGLIRRKGRNLYVTDKAKLQLIIKELQHTGRGRD